MNKTGVKAGDVFLVSVSNALVVPAMVTHVGKYPLLFSAFSLKAYADSITLSEAVESLCTEPLWRTVMGPLGFRLLSWPVIGTVEVPKQLRELPLFNEIEGLPPMEYDSKTLLPARHVTDIKGREVVEGGLPGHLFIVERLRRLTCGL